MKSSSKRILQWENYKNILSPPLKNHTTTLVDNELYIFGGYDGRKNYSITQIFDCKSLKWIKKEIGGNSPESRNGHTATLVDRFRYYSLISDFPPLHFYFYLSFFLISSFQLERFIL